MHGKNSPFASCRTHRSTFLALIHPSCPPGGWSLSFQIQISLRLTLPAFPRPPVSLHVHRPCQLLPRVTEQPAFTLCCQPTSFITSSPSLGHVMPLTGDGCLPPKDSWVMALVLTSRRGGAITCHPGSARCESERRDNAKRKSERGPSR